MIKVFSIVFQSRTHPEQIGIYTTPDSPDIEHAKQVGIQNLTMMRGDLQWTALIANAIDINAEKKEIAPFPVIEAPKATVDKDAKKKETKNWALQTIVLNKDKTLFKALKKYMTEPEVKLIEEKLK